MSDNKMQPRTKSLLDFSGLRLTAEKLPNGESRPSLSIYINPNNKKFLNKVVFEVRTQVPNDKDYGKIIATADLATAYMIAQGIEDVVGMPAGNKIDLEYKDHIFIRGERSKDPVVQWKMTIGKDKNGVVFLGIQSYDSERPKIRFDFSIPFRHDLYKNGQPIAKDEESSLAARGWANAFRHGVIRVLTDMYREPEQRQRGGQQGGQRPQQQQQRSNSFDDDFSAPASGFTDDDFGSL